MEQLLTLKQIFELIGVENVVALSLAALFSHAVAKEFLISTVKQIANAIVIMRFTKWIR